MVNALILYTINHGPDTLVFEEFIDMVIDEWATKRSLAVKKAFVPPNQRLHGLHLPRKLGQHGGYKDRNTEDARRKCTVCNKNTPIEFATSN